MAGSVRKGLAVIKKPIFGHFFRLQSCAGKQLNTIKQKLFVMKTLAVLIAIFFIGSGLHAQNDDCSNFRDSWKSEKQAISKIEKANFELSETITADNSAWMTSAHFYACDNETGFLIVRGDKKTYVHQEVPKVIWSALKDAKSIGGFYNFYIKNNYKIDTKDAI
jgi:hypothetical protein